MKNTSHDIRCRWYKPSEFTTDNHYLELISEKVKPHTYILDAGAGGGDKFKHGLKLLKGVDQVIGVDLDHRVLNNPQLHKGIVADLREVPLASEYFDLIIARYVFEHISETGTFLNELRRLLKPNGCVVFLTPNKWHYVAVGSRITPSGIHKCFNQILRGRQPEDTFPTFYRLNTARDLRREFRRAGFQEDRMVFLECAPNYLVFSRLLFLLGVAYERIVNSTTLLACFRVNILGCFIKSSL